MSLRGPYSQTTPLPPNEGTITICGKELNMMLDHQTGRDLTGTLLLLAVTINKEDKSPSFCKVKFALPCGYARESPEFSGVEGLVKGRNVHYKEATPEAFEA